jgi:hypothetical protein
MELVTLAQQPPRKVGAHKARAASEKDPFHQPEVARLRLLPAEVGAEGGGLWPALAVS